MLTSIDGYIEGTNKDISWHLWNNEMDAYMMDFFKTVDTFIYGRKSYELMLDYWPSQTGSFANIMNEMPKIVFSKTLKNGMMNSKIVNGDVAETIQKEKRKPGKNMVLFAGANIASTFIAKNLIDEYRLIISPVALGSGNPLFQIDKTLNLTLSETKTFQCGNVLLIYQAGKF